MAVNIKHTGIVGFNLCCNYAVTHTQMSLIKTFLQLVISEFQTQYYTQYTHLNVNLDHGGLVDVCLLLHL